MSIGKQLLSNKSPKDLNTQKITYKLFVIVFVIPSITDCCGLKVYFGEECMIN
jgi:hypothetical protein